MAKKNGGELILNVYKKNSGLRVFESLVVQKKHSTDPNCSPDQI